MHSNRMSVIGENGQVIQTIELRSTKVSQLLTVDWKSLSKKGEGSYNKDTKAAVHL